MTMTTNQSALKQFAAATAEWANMPVVLTIDEMCAILGIGESKAYRLLSEPGFPRVKIGKTYKVYRDGLRRYLEEQTGGQEMNKLNVGGMSQ